MALWRRRTRDDEPADAIEPAPPFPEFPYHPDPRKTGSVAPSAMRCVVCGHTYGLIYTGPVFATHDDIEGALCPWCIADGSAAARLKIEFTDVGDDVPADVPGRVLDEITERTPGFTGWQQEHWLYHCADGAAFVGMTEAAGETAYRFRCRHCGIGLAYTDSP
jgi:uncharacterized protein CbrC (UPF0167 family)